MTAPFISAGDLGNFMGQDLSASELAVIMTDAACESIRAEINQFINLVEDDVIVLDGNDRTLLILPEHPIIAVSQVIVDEADPLDPSAYRIVNERGMLERIDGGVWSLGTAIHITYDHGWAVIEADVTADIPRVPSSIRVIALESAAAGMVAGRTGVGGVRSETIGRYRYDIDITARKGVTLSTAQCEALNVYRVEGVP